MVPCATSCSRSDSHRSATTLNRVSRVHPPFAAVAVIVAILVSSVRRAAALDLPRLNGRRTTPLRSRYLQEASRTDIGGRSNTCRRSTPTSGASARSAPQPAHGPGSNRTHSSGSATNASVEPGWPGCPPGLRPLLRRNDFGTGLTNGESDDGGFDEFRLFCPNCRFNSATSARSAAICSACTATRAASSS